MHDSGFMVERLTAASSRLRQRLAELQALEDNQRKRREYDRVAEERDALARKLAALYPEFAEQLAPLLAELAANDREVEFVRRGRDRYLSGSPSKGTKGRWPAAPPALRA
jgi:predicted Holliday junction resolvase-like endonuclease